MDLFDIAVARKLAGGGGGGGGGSSYTLLAEADYNVNTTSTSEVSIGTINVPAAYTSDKIIYVRTRRKEGKENGYHFGNDLFFANDHPSKSQTGAITSFGIMYRYNTGGVYEVLAANVGVYAYSISSNGDISIFAKYNFNSTKTINGTYHIEVYALDWPDNISPFA